MNSILRLTFLFAALLLPLPGSAQPHVMTGEIYGRIVDARVCAPLAYANVIVNGTTIGAMTDRKGTFRLRNVPAGEQHLKVMMMTYHAIDAMVSVSANDSVRADFVLQTKWIDRIYPKPPIPPDTCPVHLAQMRWVLTQTTLGQRIIVDPAPTKPFPNAWPSLGSEQFKALWGASCPECVAEENAVISRQRWGGLTHSAVRWEVCRIRGMVMFKAPRGVRHVALLGPCTKEAVWEGRNVRVEIHRTPPFWHRLDFKNQDYQVSDVVGDCRAFIRVKETGKSTRIIAALPFTTNSIDDLEISIVASGKDANRIARTILGTMRFPEPD